MQFQSKSPFHPRDRKKNPKIHTNHKRPQIAKTILIKKKKENNAGGIATTDLNIYYKVREIKIWY